MARLLWNSVGNRFFEAGVDRGVFYSSGIGVAWDGLTSVKESPSGGVSQAYYMDGVKYLQVANSEEFIATLDAYSSPPEFDALDGNLKLYPGLYITQQPRKQFALSYRTMIGNDLNNTDFGYKIHIVYNALARPSIRNNGTLNQTLTPLLLSWEITTVPPMFAGLKPSSHIIVDSRTTPKDLLSVIEGRLYGTSLTPPSCPTLDELIQMFSLDQVSYLIEQNLVTGISPLIPTWNGFVVNGPIDGVYSKTASSNKLVQAGTGLYLLES